MTARQPMRDLLVVLPGIMGSVLLKDGREIWGLSGRTVVANLVSLGRHFRQLTLPEGIGDDSPEDGVAAAALMPSAQMIPGFWNLIDGYSELVSRLERRFDLKRATLRDPGNLLLFPYDWRLSNRFNGRRLAETAMPALKRWREASGAADARLVLIGHSMGGLVARWFLEMEGGKGVTRRLVTMGTPYRGSINALVNLVDGFGIGLGPLRIALDPLLRSFPSVHQLLPTYRCIEGPDGSLKSLDNIKIPGLDQVRATDATGFHRALVEAVDHGGAYDIWAIKGNAQPTFQSARITAAGIEPLRSYGGADASGDGTVPEPSAQPPEWDQDRAGTIVWTACQHGALQNSRAALDQIDGILQQGRVRFLAEPTGLGLDIPELVEAGAPFRVRVISHPPADRLALRAEMIHEKGRRIQSDLMRGGGDGAYSTVFAPIEPGAWRIRVAPADPFARHVEPVAGLTLVWGGTETAAALK